MHNKCNAPDSSRNQPPHPQSVEKIVVHETGPWCLKGWGPLIKSISVMILILITQSFQLSLFHKYLVLKLNCMFIC